MTHRLWSLVAIVAVGGALLAGCGSSSSSSSSSTSSAPAANTTTTTGSTSTGTASSSSTGASTSTGSAGGAAAVANNPAVKAAVAQCKTAINSAAQLSSASKAKLVGLCDKAASGKLNDLKSVTYEVCKQVITDSLPVAEQQAALASCPKP
jgi:hypothetical protein